MIDEWWVFTNSDQLWLALKTKKQHINQTQSTKTNATTTHTNTVRKTNRFFLPLYHPPTHLLLPLLTLLYVFPHLFTICQQWINFVLCFSPIPCRLPCLQTTIYRPYLLPHLVVPLVEFVCISASIFGLTAATPPDTVHLKNPRFTTNYTAF